jgi:hypothetical protein
MMSLPEVAAELKYSSVAALRIALRRKTLALTPLRIPGRRASLYKTFEVAAVLDAWVYSVTEEAM